MDMTCLRLINEEFDYNDESTLSHEFRSSGLALDHPVLLGRRA